MRKLRVSNLFCLLVMHRCSLHTKITILLKCMDPTGFGGITCVSMPAALFYMYRDFLFVF